MAEVVLLRSMDRHIEKDTVKLMIEMSLKYFPELKDETIYVGILRENDDAEGRANTHNRIILFKPNKVPTFVTVFHELMHIAIEKVNENGGKLPKTEEFCSIAAMARMPPNWVDEDAIPYIGAPKIPIPINLYPELCRRALEYRKQRRDYIRWLRERIGANIWGEPNEETRQRLLSEVNELIEGIV